MKAKQRLSDIKVMTEDQLADLVTRDSMIGTALARKPEAGT